MITRSAEGETPLRSLSLEITSGCNLRCLHCYAESGPGLAAQDVLGVHDYLRLIVDARDLGCRMILFIGGEPTTYAGLPELIRCARRNDYQGIEVFTNATLLSDSLLRIFRDCNVLLLFSFYSNVPAAHDSITQVTGSFARTVSGIRRALALGVSVTANVVTMETNSSTINDTRDFLDRLGVTSVGTERVRGIGRGRTMVSSSGFDELCHRCWAGSLAVGSDGNCYPCPMGREFPVGNIRNASLAEIVNGARLKEFRLRSFARYKERKDARRHDAHGAVLSCGPERWIPDSECDL